LDSDRADAQRAAVVALLALAALGLGFAGGCGSSPTKSEVFALDPQKVYLHSDLAVTWSTADFVITPVPSTGEMLTVGFSGLRAFILPSGDIVTSEDAVYQRAGDTLVQGQFGCWTYSPASEDNDTLIAPATGAVRYMLIAPDTGQLALATPEVPWADTNGQAIPWLNAIDKNCSVINLGARSTALLECYGSDKFSHFAVADSTGRNTPLPIADRIDWIPAHRSFGDGFRLITGTNDATGIPIYSRWTIYADGSAQRDGVFAPPPSGIDHLASPTIMDGDGIGYGIAEDGSFRGHVIRFPLSPDTSSIVATDHCPGLPPNRPSCPTSTPLSALDICIKRSSADHFLLSGQ
jgi:hypothetical protein